MQLQFIRAPNFSAVFMRGIRHQVRSMYTCLRKNIQSDGPSGMLSESLNSRGAYMMEMAFRHGPVVRPG
jgi:hypothetical protein